MKVTLPECVNRGHRCGNDIPVGHLVRGYTNGNLYIVVVINGANRTRGMLSVDNSNGPGTCFSNGFEDGQFIDLGPVDMAITFHKE